MSAAQAELSDFGKTSKTFMGQILAAPTAKRKKNEKAAADLQTDRLHRRHQHT